MNKVNDTKTNIQTEDVMNWWYDISDYKTEELIMKYNMKKPIKEEKILEVYKIEHNLTQ